MYLFCRVKSRFFPPKHRWNEKTVLEFKFLVCSPNNRNEFKTKCAHHFTADKKTDEKCFIFVELPTNHHNNSIHNNLISAKWRSSIKRLNCCFVEAKFTFFLWFGKSLKLAQFWIEFFAFFVMMTFFVCFSHVLLPVSFDEWRWTMAAIDVKRRSPIAFRHWIWLLYSHLSSSTLDCSEIEEQPVNVTFLAGVFSWLIYKWKSWRLK